MFKFSLVLMKNYILICKIRRSKIYSADLYEVFSEEDLIKAISEIRKKQIPDKKKEEFLNTIRPSFTFLPPQKQKNAKRTFSHTCSYDSSSGEGLAEWFVDGELFQYFYCIVPNSMEYVLFYL